MSRDRPDLILFDMDGVLVDSVDAWLGVVNRVRVDLGFDAISQPRLMEIFGQGVEDDAKNLFQGYTPAAIRAAYDEAMPDFVERVRAGSGTREVLRDLEARDIRRAVVTNTQHSLAGDMLRAAGLADAFDLIAAAGLADREKPHPDLLLTALKELGVEAERALMVGDTSYDEEAAAAAGVPYLHFDLRRGGDLRAALGAFLT